MQIVWSATAIANLVDIREYVAQDKPGVARRLAHRILAAVKQLSQHPYLGHPGREPETRELIVAGTPYIIAYRVRGSRLTILAVLHAARERP